MRGGLRFQLEIENLGKKSDAAEEAAGLVRNGNGESINDEPRRVSAGWMEGRWGTAKTPDKSLDDDAAQACGSPSFFLFLFFSLPSNL